MEKFRSYFLKQLLFDFKISKFNSTLSGLLVIFQKVQALYILLNDEMRSKLFSLDSDLAHSQSNDDFLALYNKQNQQIFWVLLTTNCIIMLLFIFRCISYTANPQNDQIMIVKLLSFTLRSYQYIFFIPSFYISLTLEYNLAPVILNMIIVLIICNFLLLFYNLYYLIYFLIKINQFYLLHQVALFHLQFLEFVLKTPIFDQNFLFFLKIVTGTSLINFDFQLVQSENDHLQKFPSKYFEEISFVLMILLTINNTKSLFSYQDVFFLIFSIYNIIMIQQGLSFINQTIRIIEYIGNIILLGFSLTLISQRIINNNVSLFFVSIAIFPLLLKIAFFYEQKNYNLIQKYMNYTQKKTKKNIYFLIHCLIQNLKNSNYVDYAQQSNSQVIDDIISNHKQSCLNYPDCFCYFQTQTVQDVWDNVISDDKRILFILNFINNLLTQQIVNNSKEKLNDWKISEQSLELKFIYLNFLMNVSQSKTNCLYQLHLLQQKQQSLNLKSKMYLEYLNQIILRKKVEFQLNQQISQSFNILLTEDKINNLKIHYEKFLINKLEVLNLIDKDYIQLEQLQQLALQLLKSKQQLQVLKHEIQKKQRNNHLFVKMIPLLQKSIGFNLKQDNENQANYFEGSQNLYHQQYLNQASALISLNKDGISSLLKASQNFCDIFEISSPQGLDIYDFIPLELQKEHKQLICQYFQQYSAGIVQQQRDQIEAKQRMNFVIGQTSQGFCIPLKIQFSIEQISSVNEIAAFATFTPINLSSYFIISDVISSKIRFVSKNFQSLYLNNVIDSQKLQQTEIQSFLPILKIQQITKNIINDDEISSYAILPTQEYFSRNVVYSYQNLIDILSNQQFNQNIFQIFKVNLKVHHLKLIKNSTFQTIQIYSMTIIQQQQEQAVAFNQLKQLLKKSQSLSPNCINETKQKAKISNILDSPDNHVSSANTTVLCPQQKQLYVNSLHQNLPSTGQFLDTEENNQNSCRSKNNQKTIVDIVDSNYLKMNSQRSSLLTIKMNKNSLTTANTFQDYVQIQQQFNKSYLDFILNQLYPNSTYRDSDEVNQQINFSKPIDGVIEIQPSFEQMQNSINENQRYQIQHSLQPTSNKVDENVIKINPGYSIQSQLLIKQASNNESSLFYVQNNDQKNKKDENENSSQNSGKTGHQIQIKTVYNKLSNKKLNKSLFVLSLFGLFTLFLIIGLSVFQFVEMINGLKSIQFDLHFVSWPASISSTCNEIWMYINLYLIQDSKIFPKLSESWINYSTDIEQKWVQLQKYGQYIYHDQIISDYDIGWYFLDITYRRNTYYIPKQDLPSTSVFKLIRYGDSELVFMQDYMANMYYYFLKIYDSQEAQLMLTENYQLMQYDLKFLDQQISNSSISVDVITVMVIVIALTFSQVLLTLPIYLYIQNEREFILKLFSTLQKQSIDKMKISCKESLQLLESTNTNLQQNSQKKQKDQRYKIFSLNNSIKRQSLLSEIENVNSRKTLAYQAMELNTKKKLISQTSQIKKMNFVLPLYGLAVFVIISIQPILNSVLVSTFKKDCITIFLGLDALFAMKDTLTKSIAFNYGNIYSKLADNKVSHLYNPLFFEQNLQSIFQEGQQNFMKMQNVANTIQQQSSNRNEYLEIITQIYEENICDLINQYPNMFKLENQIEFNFEQCNQIRGGILTQGFLVSSKYFLDQINDLFQIASIKDAQIRKIKFIQWEDGFNLKEFNTFYEYMSFIASFTQKIFLDNGYSKINDMWTIQYVLVSTQAFLVLIMYIFGWKKFFKVISSQLYKNKKIITLFEPDCIIENPYFMNYISKLK